MRKNQKGFTFVELLIVLLIIAVILLTINQMLTGKETEMNPFDDDGDGMVIIANMCDEKEFREAYRQWRLLYPGREAGYIDHTVNDCDWTIRYHPPIQ